MEVTQNLPIQLPIRWPPGLPRRLRLLRRFGRPQVDPQTESVWLSLENVPGLLALALNGRPLIDNPRILQDHVLRLPELALRNELMLEVDCIAAMETAAAWGEIALLIRPLAAP